MLPGQLHQGFAAFLRQQRAARNGVEQLGALAGRQCAQQIGQGFCLQALLVHGNGQDARLGQTQGLQRRGIGRHLDQHRVAGLDEHAHQQVKGLLRSGGHEDVGGRRMHAALARLLRQGLAQLAQAFGGAILQRAGALGHGLLCSLGQALGIEEAWRCVAAGQRDHAGAREIGKQLAYRRSRRLGKHRGKGSQCAVPTHAAAPDSIARTWALDCCSEASYRAISS